MAARLYPQWLIQTLPLGEMSDAALGEKLRCSGATVAGWRKKLGIPAHGKKSGAAAPFFESRAFYDVQDFVLLLVNFRVPIPFRQLYRDLLDDYGHVCQSYFHRTLQHMVDMGLLIFVSSTSDGNLSGAEQGYLLARKRR